MLHGLCPVDEDTGANAPRRLDDLADGVDRSQDIRDVRDGDQPRAISE